MLVSPVVDKFARVCPFVDDVFVDSGDDAALVHLLKSRRYDEAVALHSPWRICKLLRDTNPSASRRCLQCGADVQRRGARIGNRTSTAVGRQRRSCGSRPAVERSGRIRQVSGRCGPVHSRLDGSVVHRGPARRAHGRLLRREAIPGRHSLANVVSDRKTPRVHATDRAKDRPRLVAGGHRARGKRNRAVVGHPLPRGA